MNTKHKPKTIRNAKPNSRGKTKRTAAKKNRRSSSVVRRRIPAIGLPVLAAVAGTVVLVIRSRRREGPRTFSVPAAPVPARQHPTVRTPR
ncbi:MAG: hypothetical protein ACTHZD_15325 [Micrococcaceae bacterium]